MEESLKRAGNIMEALADGRGFWGVRGSKRLDVTALWYR